ncbi:ABC transporter substrate-binding protein [Geobacter hydrogenophilus]|uniref:ABC transporter substrate-binding protein n=1 Tax=Geobacter hydrogenophilus TaxID=40983 RepID=UPI002493C15B|nr:ABC transporter substrate-binding protein [Geobacter hydrogenophilus]
MNSSILFRMLATLALAFTLLLPAWPCEAARKVLVLQSLRVAPYEEAAKGVRSAVTGNIKKLVLSDLDGLDAAKSVRDERPDVIVAIGTEAMNRVKKIKDTPIVYLMVFDQHNTLTTGSNITGIGMHVAPERQLISAQKALPRLKRVGTLYNPARSGALFRKTQAMARSLGIDLVAREVRSSRDALNLVEGMKGDIEAFLMLPDATILTPETVEYLLLFSLNNRIPIITFSDKYVQMGALMALDVDPYEVGRQAGEMVRKILSGTPPESIPRSEPHGAVIMINSKIARKLGLSLNEEVLSRAKVIR